MAASKLTPEQFTDVVRRYQADEPLVKVAADYGMTVAPIILRLKRLGLWVPKDYGPWSSIRRRGVKKTQAELNQDKKRKRQELKQYESENHGWRTGVSGCA